MGFALAEAISLPPDFTKPISRRPREMTSAVAYSSATRTGSCRSEISVPSVRIRDLPRLPGEDPEEHRIGGQQRVDAGVVLDGQHVHPEIVAEQELVDHLLEQVGGDLRDRSTCSAGWPARSPSRPGSPGGRTGTALRTATKRPSVLSRRGLRVSVRGSAPPSRRRSRPARSPDGARPPRSARSGRRESDPRRRGHRRASPGRRWLPRRPGSAP